MVIAAELDFYQTYLEKARLSKMSDPLKHFKNPPGGVPGIVDSEKALEQVITKLHEAPGAIAIDAERASGYTYSQQAYLLQIKKASTPTFLIDPTLEINYQSLKQVINENNWILHAATQDLPCLYNFELKPKKIFDTELAAKLLQLPRISLLGLLEDRLKISIDKAHSAVNWASRPLRPEWLSYAALDVEFLHSLQDDLHQRLIESEKFSEAEKAFDSLLSFQPNPPRPEAWRGTSGIHKLNSRRQAAIVREVWQMRDQIAQRENLAPHRVCRDEKIIQLALSGAVTKEDFAKIFKDKKNKESFLDELLAAYQAARDLSSENWPPLRRTAKRE